ncbi:hypothetical protein [Marimonas arenosa]|uniref:Polyketide cyclase/dehydrase/lipid transport protein n=1 Tax=Marimonas arenosa TaxID=1795305 RepID=A0AAE3WBC1_9RHOB|nr:hypothetical protein [Marimonas arenosa]MDQ2089489.1 hypothetical protein [Marimonas arenosa]
MTNAHEKGHVVIKIATQTCVPGLTGRDITEFLMTCDTRRYQAWWPGTHLRFFTRDGGPGHVGSRFFMDEYVGRHRVRVGGRVIELDPGRRLVLKLSRFVPLPVWLTLDLRDTDDGVVIRHEIAAGFRGAGRVFDPLFRLHFNRRFATDMDAHVREEFSRLPALLATERAASGAIG